MNSISLNKLRILLENKWHTDIYLPKKVINKLNKITNLYLPNFPKEYVTKFIYLIKLYNLKIYEKDIKSYANMKKFPLISSSYINLYDNKFFISNKKNYFIPKNIKITIIDCFKDTELFFSTLLNKSTIFNMINELQLLNTMLMSKLVIIEIKENQKIKDILEINSLITDIEEKLSFFSIHIIFILGKNSYLKVLHNQESISNKKNESLNTINSDVIEINLAENSFIEYTNLQNLNNDTYKISNMIIKQDKNSTYKLNNISTGSNYKYNNLEVYQNESNASSDINWLNVGIKDQYFYDTIKIIHKVSNGKSKQKFRGIFKENASSWIKSFIKINENLNNIITEQKSRSLLLSDKAYVRVDPFMEIYSKDINCNHAVAIDQLEYESIFYLQSRGISLINAKKIITLNFIEKFIKEISENNIKNFVANFLKEKINKIFIL